MRPGRFDAIIATRRYEKLAVMLPQIFDLIHDDGGSIMSDLLTTVDTISLEEIPVMMFFLWFTKTHMITVGG